MPEKLFLISAKREREKRKKRTKYGRKEKTIFFIFYLTPSNEREEKEGGEDRPKDDRKVFNIIFLVFVVELFFGKL